MGGVDLGTENFRRTRPGAEGYDKDEVDRFVAQIKDALRHQPPTMAPWEVRDKLFKVGRFHRGYVEHDVDDFLDRAEQALRRAHGPGLSDPQGQVLARRTHPILVFLLSLLTVLAMLVGGVLLISRG